MQHVSLRLGTERRNQCKKIMYKEEKRWNNKMKKVINNVKIWMIMIIIIINAFIHLYLAVWSKCWLCLGQSRAPSVVYGSVKINSMQQWLS